jgi:hypothetical protein
MHRLKDLQCSKGVSLNKSYTIHHIVLFFLISFIVRFLIKGFNEKMSLPHFSQIVFEGLIHDDQATTV